MMGHFWMAWDQDLEDKREDILYMLEVGKMI